MLPAYIDFETHSYCNRRCSTCIRNSHPDREVTRTFFEKHYLDIDVIKLALDQCVELGYTGGICLSHYNEPLMDERLPEIARMVKSYNQFKSIFFNSNGDFINEELASELDGVMDRIIFTLYMDEPIKSQRKVWIESLFHKTKIDIITMSEHIPTHFSPKFDVIKLAEEHKHNPCTEPKMRIIINYRRQFLLCCDDVVGNFDLGTFPEISIAEHWYGRKTEIMKTIENENGRLQYSYCASCPRP